MPKTKMIQKKAGTLTAVLRDTPVHSFEVQFHPCGFASTFLVFVLYTDGTREPVKVQTKCMDDMLFRATFSTLARANEFVQALKA